MSISTHSFHAPSGIGMNFHDTSQRPAPWRSSGPVFPDSWSTPDPRLLRGDKLYIVLAMFLNKFWDYCCFTRLTQSRRTNYVQNDPGPLLGRRRRRRRRRNIACHSSRIDQRISNFLLLFQTIEHKIPSLTCIYDKQGLHKVPDRAPAPKRVVKVVSNGNVTTLNQKLKTR